MQLTSEMLLVVVVGLALIGMLMWLYVRSYRGDQQATGTINTMLLPLLVAATTTLGYINSERNRSLTCTHATNTIFILGIVASVALLAGGVARTFILNPRHDRIHITHAVLFVAMAVVVVFLVVYLNGCLF